MDLGLRVSAAREPEEFQGLSEEQGSAFAGTGFRVEGSGVHSQSLGFQGSGFAGVSVSGCLGFAKGLGFGVEQWAVGFRACRV